jgi:hypothetical protein
MYRISRLVVYIRNPETPHRAGPLGPGDAEEGMLTSSGIMFLMYGIGRLLALVYIRRTLAGGKWKNRNRPGLL